MLAKILKIFFKERNAYSKIDQLRYLSQSSLLEEAEAPYMIRNTLIIISVIIILLLGWAAITNINEIAITQGEVLPSKYVQSIQHVEGGTVSEINVSEGELVEQGQVLIKLSNTAPKNDLESLMAKKLSLDYQSLRLKAFINQTTPDFSEIGQNRDEKMEMQQIKTFQSMINAKEAERRVIDQQITQKKESLEVLDRQKITLAENIKLVSEERDLKKQLMEKGQISRFDFLNIQKQLNQIRGELDSIESEIDQAKNAINEYENRLNSLNTKFIDDAYQALNQVNTDLVQVDEAIQKLSDKIRDLDIKSPVYGYVKGLKVKTIGGVVEAGKVIIEIVPLEGTLVVETKINPRDVGHIKTGLPVMVKISSYDYTRYGAINGKLDYISATTFINEDGTTYYLGKISLEKNYIGEDPSKNIILPGMTVEADIVTGSKTILEYLLKPIRSSITSAFTER